MNGAAHHALFLSTETMRAGECSNTFAPLVMPSDDSIDERLQLLRVEGLVQCEDAATPTFQARCRVELACHDHRRGLRMIRADLFDESQARAIR